MYRTHLTVYGHWWVAAAFCKHLFALLDTGASSVYSTA